MQSRLNLLRSAPRRVRHAHQELPRLSSREAKAEVGRLLGAGRRTEIEIHGAENLNASHCEWEGRFPQTRKPIPYYWFSSPWFQKQRAAMLGKQNPDGAGLFVAEDWTPIREQNFSKLQILKWILRTTIFGVEQKPQSGAGSLERKPSRAKMAAERKLEFMERKI